MHVEITNNNETIYQLMAKSNNKNQPEEKNKIDELNESLTSAGAKIAENKSQIGWIICGVLVVVGAVAGFFYYRSKSNTESAQKYAKLEQDVYKAVMKEKNPNDSIFNARYLAALEKIIASDGSKSGGNLARIAAAQKYYDEGKYQKTIDYLAKADIPEPVLAAQCKILTGDCYVGLNKLADALKCYDEAVKDGMDYPQVVLRALLKKALVLDEQKKYADALAIYKQIKKEYPREMEEYSMYSTQGGPESSFSIDAYIAREEARMAK